MTCVEAVLPVRNGHSVRKGHSKGPGESLRLVRWIMVAALAAASLGGGPASAQDRSTSAFAEAILHLEPALGRPDWRAGRRGENDALWRMYDGADASALWSAGGRPTRQAREVLDFLEGVASRGLDPADYAIEMLRLEAAAVANAAVPDSGAVARFDVLLSRSLLRVLAHLHEGRIDPRTLRADLPRSAPREDFVALALKIRHAPDVGAALSAVEPPYEGYASLVRALIRYRELAAAPELRPPRFPAHAVRPGEAYADAPALRRLLVASGDLEPVDVVTDTAGAGVYDDALVDAVVLFQRRHGLEPDGVLGRATTSQLRVPLSERVRQIELTLERWRWLPDRTPPRYVLVNVPEFRLHAFEGSPAAPPALTMKVIVGGATGGHSTPLFAATMREVVFRPYWDVPLRIARTELLPIIRRRPGYLAAEEMEVVRGGDYDAVVYAPNATNLARVAAGTLRLRQRPGPKNALGAVKFVFPNPYSVYLHGTPVPRLFDHVRRDFSHGCIRTEDPTALAEFVLRGQEGWGRPEIEDAMRGERTVHVTLDEPLPVFIIYATAVARADVVSFHPDLYGRDAALAKALGLRASRLVAPAEPSSTRARESPDDAQRPASESSRRSAQEASSCDRTAHAAGAAKDHRASDQRTDGHHAARTDVLPGGR